MFKRLVSILVGSVLSVAASLVGAYVVAIRPLRRSWGFDRDEAARALPGDDVVPVPGLTETRGITIDATPGAVWPWLPQMGYGRAGWYSYDRLDNAAHSATRILREHQSLAVGDIVPTWPGGGFQVAAVDPGRSLVLYLDTELAKAQAAAAERPPMASLGQPAPAPAANLKAAGAMGGAALPVFKASWAFVVEPVDATHTRLIERFRVWAPEPTLPQRVLLPVLGLGVFLMTRKQLLGLKERAERTAVATAEPRPASLGAAA